MNTETFEDRFVSRETAARLLDCHKSQVDRLRRAGVLSYHIIGKGFKRFLYSDIMKLKKYKARAELVIITFLMILS